MFADWIIRGLDAVLRGDYDQSRIDTARDRRAKRLPASKEDRAHRDARATALYGKSHPYGRPEASPGSLRRIDLDDLRQFRHRFTPGHAVLVVSGGFDRTLVMRYIEETFGKWRPGTASETFWPPPLPSAPQAIGVTGDRDALVRLSLGYRVGSVDRGETAAGLVLEQIVGDRVAAVRTQLGVSYGVHVHRQLHRTAGAFLVEGEVAAERAGEALASIRGAVAATHRGDIPPGHFEQARRAVQLIDQALAAGHHVVAVVRDPARLPIRHERLRFVTADVLDPGSIVPALTGADAVLSVLGPRFRRASINAAAVRSIVQAMHTTGVRRIVALSAAPVAAPDAGDTFMNRWLLGPFIRAFLKHLCWPIHASAPQQGDWGAKRSCCAPVIMVQAAQDGTRDHTVGHDRLRSVSRAIECVGAVLADALVGPARVVQRAHNTHFPERRRLAYPWHPLYGHELVVHGDRRRAGLTVLRCHVEGDERRDAMHIPAWMFDGPACGTMKLEPRPRVPFHTLVELRRILDETQTAAWSDSQPRQNRQHGENSEEATTRAAGVAWCGCECFPDNPPTGTANVAEDFTDVLPQRQEHDSHKP